MEFIGLKERCELDEIIRSGNFKEVGLETLYKLSECLDGDIRFMQRKAEDIEEQIAKKEAVEFETEEAAPELNSPGEWRKENAA